MTPVVAAAALFVGTAQAQNLFRPSGSPAKGAAAKSIQHNGQSFAVVPASEASLLDAPGGLMSGLSANAYSDVGLVGFQNRGGNCGGQSCNGESCNESCGGNCNSGAGFGSAYSNSCNSGCLACPTCDPYRYVRTEAVYMRRNGLDNFTRSRFFGLDDYDFELAPRITIGSVPDCVNGTEFTFTGPINWSNSNTVLNRSGQTFLSELIPANALTVVPPSQTIGFTFLYDPEADPVAIPANDPEALVDIQRQRYESRYWSAEINRTMMDWDVVKFLYGGRYINFEEEYSYTASNAARDNGAGGTIPAQSGRLLSETQNNLVGLQVGLDIYNPVCRNTSSFTRARGGIYYNFAEGTVLVDDQGDRLYGANDDDNGLAFMFEINSGIEYRLSEMLSVHAGGEFMYITEVATAEDNIPSLVGARAGSRGITAGDDVTFVGFNLGATVKF